MIALAIFANESDSLFYCDGRCDGGSVYRRLRRNIGKQKLRPGRTIALLVLFCIASFFIVIAEVPRMFYLDLVAAF